MLQTHLFPKPLPLLFACKENVRIWQYEQRKGVCLEGFVTTPWGSQGSAPQQGAQPPSHMSVLLLPAAATPDRALCTPPCSPALSCCGNVVPSGSSAGGLGAPSHKLEPCCVSAAAAASGQHA